MDMEGYTEQCLGLTGWTTGAEIALQNLYVNFVQPWADMKFSEEETVAGPDAKAAAGMVFDDHKVQATDTVVVRSRVDATHVGMFLGIPATGRRISWDHVTMVWVRAGRVVGQWAQPDLWGIHQQLIA
jgi:predicted ester cyclase